MIKRVGKENLRAGILFSLLAIVVLIPLSPYIKPIPHVDSSVFLYIGDQILDGKIPYSDVWDHKGPLIYYINAFSLMLRQGSLWGIWGIEIISLISATLLSFFGLKNLFGKTPAAWGTILWVLSLSHVIFGGNYTEEYSILFQVWGLFIFINILKGNKGVKSYVLLGVLAALVFYLRPNNGSVFVAIFMVLLINVYREKKGYKELFLVGASGIVILLLVYGYFYAVDAWDDFLDAFFRFNLLYARTFEVGFEDRIEFFKLGFSLLPAISYVGVTGWGLAVFSRFRKIYSDESMEKMVDVLILWLPIQFWFSALSGRAYKYYFILWVPVLGVASAYFIYWVLEKWKDTVGQDKVEVENIWVWILLIAMVFWTTVDLVKPNVQFLRGVGQARGLPMVDYKNGTIEAQVIEDLVDYLGDEDYLLVWGHGVLYNLYTGTEAPSKYLYLVPLLTPGYVDDEIVNQVLEDIKNKKPVIVDAAEFTNNRYATTFFNEDWGPDNPLEPIREYVVENYDMDFRVDGKDWAVLHYVGK